MRNDGNVVVLLVLPKSACRLATSTRRGADAAFTAHYKSSVMPCRSRHTFSGRSGWMFGDLLDAAQAGRPPSRTICILIG